MGAAIGLRPGLAALGVALLAAGDLGVDFDGTSFSYLESPVMTAFVALLAASLLAGARPAAWLAASVLVAAWLGAAQIDDRHDTWWIGLVLGAAAAVPAALASREVVERVRTRLTKGGDSGAARALPVYLEIVGLVVALLCVALPPLGLVALGFVIALLIRQRRRAGEKYAGLRVLK